MIRLRGSATRNLVSLKRATSGNCRVHGMIQYRMLMLQANEIFNDSRNDRNSRPNNHQSGRRSALGNLDLQLFLQQDIESLPLIKQNKNPDYQLIGSLLTHYDRRNQLQPALQLANRMLSLKITPSSQILSCLVSLLLKQDRTTVEPVLLAMFESAVKFNISLSHRLLRSLTWSMRATKDPLYPHAVKSLVDKLALQSENWQYSPEERASDLILAYIQTGQIEAAYHEYCQASDQQLKLNELPLRALTEELLLKIRETGPVVEIVKDAERYGVPVADRVYYIILSHSVEQLDYEMSKFAYSRIRQLNNPIIPTGILIPFLTVCASHGDTELCKAILKHMALQGTTSLPVPAAVALIDLVVKTKPDINTVLETLETVHALQPALTVVDILPSCKELVAGKDEDELSSLINQVIQFTNTRPGISLSMRTFLMNCIVLGVGLSRQASYGFYVFHRFINKTTSSQDFVPDNTTFFGLFSCAYRLGNAKKFSYIIYKDMIERFGLKPDRRLFETILKTQLVGRDYSSALYFLNQMRAHNVNLRNNMHYLLYRNFQEMRDRRFSNLFKGDLAKNLERYDQFPLDEDLKRAELGQQFAKRYYSTSDFLNCQNYKEGWLHPIYRGSVLVDNELERVSSPSKPSELL